MAPDDKLCKRLRTYYITPKHYRKVVARDRLTQKDNLPWPIYDLRRGCLGQAVIVTATTRSDGDVRSQSPPRLARTQLARMDKKDSEDAASSFCPRRLSFDRRVELSCSG